MQRTIKLFLGFSQLTVTQFGRSKLSGTGVGQIVESTHQNHENSPESKHQNDTNGLRGLPQDHRCRVDKSEFLCELARFLPHDSASVAERTPQYNPALQTRCLSWQSFLSDLRDNSSE